MLAKDLITDEIPPLKTSDTGLKALSWMDEFKVSHLPIVNNQDFLGLISDSDILDLNHPEDSIGNHKLSLVRPVIKEHQHIYDVISLVTKLKLTLVPVVNDEEHFIGVITMPHLVENFAKITAISEPGGVIVLEVNIRDYSLTEISRIVESNDAKIISSYVASDIDSTKVEVTIKVNRTDVSAVLQTFYRFNYVVKASYHQSEFLDDMKNRFDAFMNYINI